MWKRTTNLLAITALLIAIAWVPIAQATTFYVDDDGPYDPLPGDPSGSDPDEDGTLDHPFDAIQEAINVCANGDIVEVANGTYTGAGNKNLEWDPNTIGITVKSENGPTNCTIDCDDEGRAFYLNNNYAASKENVIEGFKIIGGDLSDEAYENYPDGGGIFAHNALLTIKDCIFKRCSARWEDTSSTFEGNGGAIWVQNTAFTCGTPYIIECSISDCRAAKGGAIYLGEGDSWQGTYVWLVSCTIGPAEYDPEHPEDLNIAQDGGGGIYVDSYVRLRALDCTFIGNDSDDNGGAIYVHGISSTGDSSIQVEDCVITYNSAVLGAGIYADGAAGIDLSGCEISHNTASGAGIYIKSLDTLALDHCKITDNCGGEGGGIFILSLDEKGKIHNSYFANNHVEDNGGAILAGQNTEDVELDILGCTFYDNEATLRGNAIYTQAADLTVKNSIFWDESVQGDKNFIYLDHYGPPWVGSSVDISYSDIRGGKDNIVYNPDYSTRDYDDQTNVETDPDFEDDNLHLKSTSTLIDKGDGDPVGRDIDNGYRAVCLNQWGCISGIDIGADEQDCFPITSAYEDQYADWKTLGRPDCWCNSYYLVGTPGTDYQLGDYQCDGDADGDTETFWKYRVYGNDYALITANWKKTAEDYDLNPCADIDHKSYGFFKWRVYVDDLNIVISNWEKKDANLPGNCPRPD